MPGYKMISFVNHDKIKFDKLYCIKSVSVTFVIYLLQADGVCKILEISLCFH